MMLQPSCLVFFITLWFSLERACKASMTTPGKFFPLPTNLKILLYPGIINVTWDCNITKSMEEHTYKIEFPCDVIENMSISKCFHEHFVMDHLEFTLYNGLELNISSGSEWKFEKAVPEGNSNTSAEDLDCKVYNVSLVNCSWTVGREAPKDTQYALAFRETPHESQILNPKQNRLYVPCKDYRTDSFGRQVGCVLRAQNISFNVSIYVQLVGSSNETSIQFFDEKIQLDHFEPESSSFTPNHLLLVLGIITFAVALLLMFLCHRFQVWKRLFPQIPKPAKKIFESIEQIELLEQITTKKTLPEEDEECICLQVTEIPQNEQPQDVNIGIHQEDYSNIY